MKRIIAIIVSVAMLFVCSGCSIYKGVGKNLLNFEEKAENSIENNEKAESKEKEIVLSNARSIAVSENFIVGLTKDGTVKRVQNYYAPYTFEAGWTDITAVFAGHGHIVGLKSDGTVVATGNNDEHQCIVSSWENVVDIHAGLECTFGLTADGEVLATVYQNGGKRVAMEGFSDIAEIEGVGDKIFGLRKDGTVVAKSGVIGSNVKKIRTNIYYALFIKNDGSVKVYGDSQYKNEIESWTDIADASTYYSNHAVGLKNDGTVVAAGQNKDGRCNVSDWTDIVAVATGMYHTVGLKADGTVVATGHNGYGQCDVSDWKDIVGIYTGDVITVGLKKNGTAVVAGGNWYENKGDIFTWKNLKVMEEETEEKMEERKNDENIEGSVETVGSKSIIDSVLSKLKFWDN